MAAKSQRKQTTKQPFEMTPEEQQQYAVSVSQEVDRLLARRGCMLEFQPGFAPAGNGTFTVGVAARIVIKPATYKGIPE
jgi:hypothetical protein